MPKVKRCKRDRSTEPRVTIGVTLLQSERDELAQWSAAAGVPMSVYMRWFVQAESETRFLKGGVDRGRP